MIYCFDIDGTLCTQTHGKYDEAQPLQNRIDFINDLYNRGHIIYLMTARGMTRTNNNVVLAYAEMYNFTKQQVDRWNIKYHALFLGKPTADFYIDDKAVLDSEFFEQQGS